MRRLAMVLGIALGLIPRLCLAVEPVEVDRQAATEFFEKKIRPLLIQRCDECHSTKKADESGHLALDNRTSLLAGGTRGPALVAGKPDDSLLIQAVRYADPKLQMPPEGKLADVEIELLSKWVREGAFVPDYGTEVGKKTKQIDWPAARQFWSFRPLVRPEVPSLRNEVGGTPGESAVALHNPVDSFIARPLRWLRLGCSAASRPRRGCRRTGSSGSGC